MAPTEAAMKKTAIIFICVASYLGIAVVVGRLLAAEMHHTPPVSLSLLMALFPWALGALFVVGMLQKFKIVGPR
jgi:hypothetical protein